MRSIFPAVLAILALGCAGDNNGSHSPSVAESKTQNYQSAKQKTDLVIPCDSLLVDLRTPSKMPVTPDSVHGRYEVIERLEINLDDTISKVVYAGREEGIQMIRTLMPYSENEEQWLFLPDSSKWIEIGYGSGIYEKGLEKDPLHPRMSVSANQRIIDEEMKRNGKLEFFHNHPLEQHRRDQFDLEARMTWERLKETFIAKGVDGPDSLSHELEKNYLMSISVPSHEDLARFAYDAQKFFKHQPSGVIAEHVISGFGVTTVTYTPDGIEAIKQGGFVHIGQMLRPSLVGNALVLGMECSKHYIAQMSTKHTQLKFSPFPEYENLDAWMIFGEAGHPEYGDIYQKLFSKKE